MSMHGVSDAMSGRAFLLQVIGVPLRRMILGQYHVDSCIASTRIGMDLLERLEIPSHPFAVEFMVFNAAFIRRAGREGRMPYGTEEVERWFAEDGSHSVGIGMQTNDQPGRHVALIVEDSYLWDLSVDQASRPDKGIVIERPILARVTPEFLAGLGSISTTYASGMVAVYRPRPGYDCWTGSPNWDTDGRDNSLRAEMVEEAYQSILQLAARTND